MNIVGWMAWFTNNPDSPGYTVYSSLDIALEDLPNDGHLGTCIFLDDKGVLRRQLYSGYKFVYWYRGPDGLVIGGDDTTYYEIQERYPDAKIMRGRDVTPEVMQLIDNEMMDTKELCNDCDFTART